MHGIVLTFMSNLFQSEQMFTEIFEQRFNFNPQPMAVAEDKVMRLSPSVQPFTAFRCMYKRWMWWATNQLEHRMPEEPPREMTCTRSSAAVVRGGLSRCVFAGGPCHYQPSVSVSSWCSQSSSPQSNRLVCVCVGLSNSISPSEMRSVLACSRERGSEWKRCRKRAFQGKNDGEGRPKVSQEKVEVVWAGRRTGQGRTKRKGEKRCISIE